jgi:large conductance mechanosensitive channel
MIFKIREFLRSESLGITIPVGVALLWALWSLILTTVGVVLIPILVELVSNDSDPFSFDNETFTAFGIQFRWITLMVEWVSFVAFAGATYWLLIRSDPEDLPSDDEMRDCPECLSSIFIEAKRCAFCTASVPPIAGSSSDGN